MLAWKAHDQGAYSSELDTAAASVDFASTLDKSLEERCCEIERVLLEIGQRFSGSPNADNSQPLIDDRAQLKHMISGREGCPQGGE